MATTTTAPSSTGDVVSRPGAEGRKINAGRIAAWAAMIILILITLFPFYWMLRTAFSTSKSLFSDPTSLLPVDFTWGAFKRVLGLATPVEAQAEGGSGAAVNFWLFLRNSIVYATLSTAGQVFFSALAAYAFSRLRWPGRDKVFFVFLTALMIPPIFVMLPNFILIRNLGLLNTFPGLILPYFFMTPFAIFFLRQFFLGINKEIEEAAKLDGAGHWLIFFRIVLPMSWAPIITLFILTFITQWNEYFWPLLVASNDKTRVLTVAIGVFRSQTPAGSPDWAGLMAAVLVAALPILILFFAFARKIVNSIGFSGVK
jgi:multiple sugar transport system permease protein